MATPERTPSAATERKIAQLDAKEVIWRAWQAYRRRQTFITMKTYLSETVLRRVSPREAALVRDRAVDAKVRFRFAGEEFPPKIVYKIFIASRNVHYICGRNLIRAHTKAAEDVLELKGAKRYAEDVVMELEEHQAYRVTDVCDIASRYDYIQHSSYLDQRPAQIGGRNNGWRDLALPPFHYGTVVERRRTFKSQAKMKRKQHRAHIDRLRQLYGLGLGTQEDISTIKSQDESEEEYDVNLFSWSADLSFEQFESSFEAAIVGE